MSVPMNAFSSIRCVTFDLDDTLWPSEPTISEAEQALYFWLDEYFPLITQHYSLEDIKKHRAEYGKAHPELAHNVTALRYQSLAELAKEFNYATTMADQGLALFRKVRNQVSFFEDAFSTIETLRDHFKIGAITNGNADLNEIGVSHKFDFIVTAEKAGAAKPDEKIFHYAQNQAQLDCNQMLLVGDTPVVDVVGARLSGWHAIWYNPNNIQWNESIKPNAEIQNLSQLVSLLIK